MNAGFTFDLGTASFFIPQCSVDENVPLSRAAAATYTSSVSIISQLNRQRRDLVVGDALSIARPGELTVGDTIVIRQRPTDPTAPLPPPIQMLVSHSRSASMVSGNKAKSLTAGAANLNNSIFSTSSNIFADAGGGAMAPNNSDVSSAPLQATLIDDGTMGMGQPSGSGGFNGGAASSAASGAAAGSRIRRRDDEDGGGGPVAPSLFESDDDDLDPNAGADVSTCDDESNDDASNGDDEFDHVTTNTFQVIAEPTQNDVVHPPQAAANNNNNNNNTATADITSTQRERIERIFSAIGHQQEDAPAGQGAKTKNDNDDNDDDDDDDDDDTTKKNNNIFAANDDDEQGGAAAAAAAEPVVDWQYRNDCDSESDEDSDRNWSSYSADMVAALEAKHTTFKTAKRKTKDTYIVSVSEFHQANLKLMRQERKDDARRWREIRRVVR